MTLPSSSVTLRVMGNSQKQQVYHGFTLIELLVVIAVIGVLAGAIIAVINPAEQLARGRDVSRTAAVSQLGKAMLAYQLSAAGGTFPAIPSSGSSWQTTYLVGSGNIKSIQSEPTVNIGGYCGGTLATPNPRQIEGNICYMPNGTGTDAYIWTLLESASYRTKLLNGLQALSYTCAGYHGIIWISSTNQTGLACFNNSGDPSVMSPLISL